ncbi:MAG: hypothetical protein CMN30_34010 [Sandaracinus sp.]|nr:hypothetical protein [Sandaracinus sp.]
MTTARRLLPGAVALHVLLATALGCGGGPEPQPVEMPVVTLPSCERGAECGEGTCRMANGEAWCECAPGFARTMPSRCVALSAEPACVGPRCDGAPGCLTPGDCAEGEVCERLTGRCLAREGLDLARATQPAGTGEEGEFCYVASAGEVRGCGDLSAGDHCGAGLHCVPSGALEHTVVCGYPERRPGVCRPTCDLAAPLCGPGRSCLFVAGSGGVCAPDGSVREGCGEALCEPGAECVLGGQIGGAAHGRCRVPCEPGDVCPDGTECRADDDRFPAATFCG